MNLDARWSPDGSRIAYVSTAFEGRFHVFVLTVGTGEAVRITEDVESPLPRYYYSKFDQYLSPTWSPDGKELILISNRGDVWGSGDLWRMEARPGAPMRLVRKEETNWKARPDWAREGKRVVYSSYLGRQRNQLWLTTADAGDPFELTYCECDHTRPRWSPDGRRIAFVSNEEGNVSLRVVTIPGGAVETIVPAKRRYLRPSGTMRITAVDPAGAALPVRLSVTGPDGRGWAPDTAWRHADDGFDRRLRTFEETYFHAKGTVSLTLPAGTYTVLATRGLEYETVNQTVTVAAGGTSEARIRPARLADLPARGWWSGDLHVHMNYGGAYRNDPAHLRAQAEAEDLHVVENLIVNKEQRIPDVARFAARLDPVSTATTLVKHDEEYHTSWWGHTGHLGLTKNLILPNYAGYFHTAAASLFPDNSTILDLAHAQDGVSGYVHPFDPPAPDPNGADPLTYALPVDVALGKADYLEIVGFSDHRITADVWYRLLNCGFRVPAGGGTDAMANYASLRGPVGMNRVFVRSGTKLDYRGWLAALKAGKTFATNGPLLSFTLDGREVGDEIALPVGRPHADGEGEPALDRPRREARDRLEWRRRRDGADRGRGNARRRHDPDSRDWQRLVRAAGLVRRLGRADPRHLSLRHHEPHLRQGRRPAGPQRAGLSILRSLDRATGVGCRRPRRLERRSGEVRRPGPPCGREGRLREPRGGSGPLAFSLAGPPGRGHRPFPAAGSCRGAWRGTSEE